MFPTPPAGAGIVHRDGFAWLGEDAFLEDFATGVDRARARMRHPDRVARFLTDAARVKV